MGEIDRGDQDSKMNCPPINDDIYQFRNCEKEFWNLLSVGGHGLKYALLF